MLERSGSHRMRLKLSQWFKILSYQLSALSADVAGGCGSGYNWARRTEGPKLRRNVRRDVHKTWSMKICLTACREVGDDFADFTRNKLMSVLVKISKRLCQFWTKRQVAIGLRNQHKTENVNSKSSEKRESSTGHMGLELARELGSVSVLKPPLVCVF